MTSSNTRHCYVGPNASDAKDHFKDLEQVAAAFGNESEVVEELIITFVDGATNPAKTKPRFQFFYDTQEMGEHGDGTDVDPWPSLAASLQRIVDLQKNGKLSAKP